MSKQRERLEEVQALLEEIRHSLDSELACFSDIDFSAAALEQIYTYAYSAYKQSHYAEAKKAFRFLTLAKTMDFDYWMGLAGCEMMLNNQHSALSDFAFCAVLSPENPLPHYYAAEIHHSLNDYKSALNALNNCLELCQSKKYADIAKRLAIYREIWIKEQLCKKGASDVCEFNQPTPASRPGLSQAMGA